MKYVGCNACKGGRGLPSTRSFYLCETCYQTPAVSCNDASHHASMEKCAQTDTQGGCARVLSPLRSTDTLKCKSCWGTCGEIFFRECKKTARVVSWHISDVVLQIAVFVQMEISISVLAVSCKASGRAVRISFIFVVGTSNNQSRQWRNLDNSYEILIYRLSTLEMPVRFTGPSQRGFAKLSSYFVKARCIVSCENA